MPTGNAGVADPAENHSTVGNTGKEISVLQGTATGDF